MPTLLRPHLHIPSRKHSTFIKRRARRVFFLLIDLSLSLQDQILRASIIIIHLVLSPSFEALLQDTTSSCKIGDLQDALSRSTGVNMVHQGLLMPGNLGRAKHRIVRFFSCFITSRAIQLPNPYFFHCANFSAYRLVMDPPQEHQMCCGRGAGR
jgi:hypothetical protein